MPLIFRASGKLLITGEYSVLQGALALSIPTKFGQGLEVKYPAESLSSWTSLDEKGNTWFDVKFDQNLQIVECSDREKASVLRGLLSTAKQKNPPAFQESFHAVSTLEFNKNWGLGSSSTLVALIAQWAEIDAMDLFFRNLTGSGFDVATAMAQQPIVYSIRGGKHHVEPSKFNPPFKDSLYFVYLGEKQKSEKEVIRFGKKKLTRDEVDTISDLTLKVNSCSEEKQFEHYLQEHENITSSFLGYKTIKEKLFPDYPRTIKSLGAWGGDFVLVLAKPSDLLYFKNKGYDTILSWKEMIGT